MTASLETLVIAAYVFADALWIPRPGPAGKITDEELIALAVAQAAMGLPSDRQFLGLVGKALARLVSASARPVPVQPPPAAARAVRQHGPADRRRADRRGQLRLADGTLIAVRQLPGLRLAQPLRRPRRATATAPPRASSSGACGSCW